MTLTSTEHYRSQIARLSAEVSGLELEVAEADERARQLRGRVLDVRARWARLVDKWVKETTP